MGAVHIVVETQGKLRRAYYSSVNKVHVCACTRGLLKPEVGTHCSGCGGEVVKIFEVIERPRQLNLLAMPKVADGTK